MYRPKVINSWIFITFTLVSKCHNEPKTLSSEATRSNDETSNSAVDSNLLYEAAVALETEIELSISAEYLLGPKGGPGILHLSDPSCVTYIQPPNGDRWIEYDRTEVVLNLCDPKFKRKVTFPMYSLDEKQLLKSEIYSVTYSKGPNLDDHFFLGQAQCELGELIKRGQTKIILRDKTYKKATLGSVIINVEKLTNNFDEVVLQLAAKKLANKDWFGKSDPFLEIYKRSADNIEDVFIYETEVVKNSLNLEWKKIIMSVRNLCSGDYNRVLRFVCYDHDNFGNDDYIGEFKTTLGEISGENRRTTFSLKDLDKKKQKVNGEIEFKEVNIVALPSFSYFIKNGLKLRCIFAIDFSDGNDELHQRPTNNRDGKIKQNKYDKAISSIVTIIKKFGLEPKFQVLGMGGQQPGGHVNDVFNLNENSSDCEGVEGVLNAYSRSSSVIKSAGLSKFAPVIQKVMQFIKTAGSYENYFILLILARGDITDLDETKHVIKEAAKLPLSIIIVGMNDSAIKNTEKLLHNDDDDNYNSEESKLANKSRKTIELRKFNTRQDTATEARRHVVHYVSYDTFRSYPPGLTRELLFRIPGQVVSYKRFYKNFKPKGTFTDLPQAFSSPDDPDFTALYIKK